MSNRGRIAIMMAAGAGLLLGAELAEARRFFDDDPLLQMPEPRNVTRAAYRAINEVYDVFSATFSSTNQPKVRARSANTVGEVPDSEWFVNRHARQRLETPELLAGPGAAHPPSMEGPWEVTKLKLPGTTPGFEFRDVTGRHYVLKLDPPEHPELGTGAEMIGVRLFHAMGYRVPESYLVRFPLSQLEVARGATMAATHGRARAIVPMDLITLLRDQPRDEDGRIRALASRRIEGEPLGPFRFYGTRSDDPNDTIPHEHRRELRGLAVPSAWLNHTEINATNTLDMLVNRNRRRYIEHYLLDFNGILGSGPDGPKSARSGFAALIEKRPALAQALTLGAWVPDWASVRYPQIAGVGRFEADFFNPSHWRADYPLPAFELARPDDLFWGTKLILSFTEADIRLVLSTAEYTDPQAVEWIVQCLLKRQEKLARYHLERVLPVDDLAVGDDGKVRFRDLSVERGYVPERSYFYQWGRFDNEAERFYPVTSATTATMPAELSRLPANSYCGVNIHAGDARRSVMAYFRKQGAGWSLVGLDRSF
jgi:hypothetical protein